MVKITRTLAGIAMLMLSGSAAATMIQGQINIGGTSLATATDITFYGASVTMFGAPINTPSGDFSGLGGLSTNNALTMYTISYLNVPPPTMIWEIDHNGLLYSFTLNYAQVLSGYNDPTCNAGLYGCLVLNGTGSFNITNSDRSYAGFTTTSGDWTYSQSGVTFSSQAIPEPGTLALLGLGLIGIGFMRRIRKTA